MKQAVFIILVLSSLLLGAQSKYGTPPYKYYSASDFDGVLQVFDIKSDSRGIVYASNNIGLMELSGNTWKVYKIKNNLPVYSLDIDNNGRIYVGGTNEFGYFDADSSYIGLLKYHSLSSHIKYKSFGEIQNVIYTNNKVYFQSKKEIFILNKDSIHILKSKNRIYKLFKASNSILTSIKDEGVFLVKDTLIKITNIHSKVLIADFDSTNNLFYSEGRGFNLVSIANNKIYFKKPFFTQIDPIIKSINPSGLCQINDSLISIKSDKGIYVINKKGKLVQILNKQQGLKSERVLGQTIDKNNILWLATENGIVKTSILSPTSYFLPKTYNYDGQILDIIRFHNSLYIITPTSLFKLTDDNQENTPITNIYSILHNYRFSKLQYPRKSIETTDLTKKLYSEITNKCWDLTKFTLPQKEILLVSTNNYVVGINSDETLEKVSSCYPYTSYQSKIDPRRVFIGLDGGIQSVYYSSSSKWIDEGRISGVSEVIRDIQEDKDGNLWLASAHQGVIYIHKPEFINHKIQNPQISKFQKGIEEGDPIRIEKINSELLFASSYGIYGFSWSDSTFYLKPGFSKNINNPKNIIHRISRDHNNNLWVVGINDNNKITTVYFLKNLSNGKFKDIKVFAKKNEIVFSFFHDKNNISWFGGTYGLGKTNESRLNDSSYSYNIYITNVLSNNDTAFGGHFTINNQVCQTQPASYIKTFDFKHNSFTFYFSASSPKDFNDLKYSWYLEGYENEKDWGRWSEKTYKEYTNLNEGHYIFHVRAIDIYGNKSEVSTYEFYVEPPWYRTIYAYFGAFILFILFVWGAIHVSTRGLNKIIKEATAEISSQKDELEAKNKNIIDSIRYAQRIQEAVLPSTKEFYRYFKESFVLWKPRDIVSGDFYWLAPKHDKIYLAAADCTGHGVPGAFMSIMGIAFLNQILGSSRVKNAAEILNQLRHYVITAINKEQGETVNKDGMDIALCIYDFQKMQIEYAGAYNPLYIVRDGELLEIKADRMPIGVHGKDSIAFKNKVVDIKKGDKIYIFSDGFVDQFGGAKEKKFMSKRFKRLLLEIEDKSMEQQKEILWQRTLEWRGDIEQIDDIIIIGILIE